MFMYVTMYVYAYNTCKYISINNMRDISFMVLIFYFLFHSSKNSELWKHWLQNQFEILVRRFQIGVGVKNNVKLTLCIWSMTLRWWQNVSWHRGTSDKILPLLSSRLLHDANLTQREASQKFEQVDNSQPQGNVEWGPNLHIHNPGDIFKPITIKVKFHITFCFLFSFKTFSFSPNMNIRCLL